MRTLILIAGLCAALVNPARAEDDRGRRAKLRYENGMAHYQLEEYDQAIDEWQEGFRIKPLPEFLYNIAQAHRLSKRAEKAVTFYQKYIRMWPEAPNRVEVERHIANLNKIIETQRAAYGQPSTQPMQPGSPPPREPGPALVEVAPPPTATAPAPVEHPRADLTAQPATKPVYKKGWFWGVMAGAAAVVVTAVVVGVVVGTGSSESSLKTLPGAQF